MSNNKKSRVVIGYPCINNTLAAEKPASKAIRVNRGMIKRTFQEKGVEYAGEVALLNLYDLEQIVEWNYQHEIYLYRMFSDMFPWSSEYVLEDLPQAKEIKKQLKHVGALAKKYKQRLTFHPGQFDVLASPTQSVIEKTIHDLEFHAAIMDVMGLEKSVYSKINIHIGGAYGDKEKAIARFCENFKKLSLSVRKRLTVENEDKESLYTVQELYDMVYQEIGIPIVFDNLHHSLHPGDLSEKEAFLLAYKTWPKDIEPIVHVAQKKGGSGKFTHADYVTQCFDTHGKKVAIMLEAKAKEVAVQKYKKTCC